MSNRIHIETKPAVNHFCDRCGHLTDSPGVCGECVPGEGIERRPRGRTLAQIYNAAFDDVERLDWLLSHLSCSDVEVNGIVRSCSTREEIDEMMLEERRNA